MDDSNDSSVSSFPTWMVKGLVGILCFGIMTWEGWQYVQVQSRSFTREEIVEIVKEQARLQERVARVDRMADQIVELKIEVAILRKILDDPSSSEPEIEK